MKNDERQLRWRGHKLNAKTILMLQSAERELGQRLVVVQGSFNNTVPTSKGTHDHGGVLDISVRTTGTTTERKVIELRRAGFAAWRRTPDQFPPEDHVPEHIHAVSIFDRDLADVAAGQRADYLADPPRNGLVGDRPDDGPRVPIPRRPVLEKQVVRRGEIVVDARNESVAFLQDVTGLLPDGFFGPVTQGVMVARHRWDGTSPMSKRLFRRLFPASVFSRIDDLQP